jgi:hypothetical protein
MSRNIIPSATRSHRWIRKLPTITATHLIATPVFNGNASRRQEKCNSINNSHTEEASQEDIDDDGKESGCTDLDWSRRVLVLAMVATMLISCSMLTETTLAIQPQPPVVPSSSIQVMDKEALLSFAAVPGAMAVSERMDDSAPQCLESSLLPIATTVDDQQGIIKTDTTALAAQPQQLKPRSNAWLESECTPLPSLAPTTTPTTTTITTTNSLSDLEKALQKAKMTRPINPLTHG